MERGRSPWLYPARGERRIRLLAFPFAGGGSTAFHELARRVRAPLELAPVLLPGRERRLFEPPFRALGPLLDALEEGLAAELDEPHALFGHSLGALVAFELARRRRASGQRGPLHLFVSACRAPQVLAVQRPVHALPDDAFLEALDGMGGMLPEVRRDEELLRLLLPALRADFEMYETYRYEPGPRIACPITALGGTDDPLVPRADLEAWRELADGGIDVEWLPGGHFFLAHEAAHLARLVDERLAAAAEAWL